MKFGFGARLCIVLSVVYLGSQGYTYNDNLERWSEKNRCKLAIGAQLDRNSKVAVEFDLVKDNSPPPNGKADYRICTRKPPYSGDDPLIVGCDGVVTESDGNAFVKSIRGPANLTRKKIEEGAAQLGLDGEVIKLLSTPNAPFSDDATKKEYSACIAKNLGEPGDKPMFDMTNALIALLAICGGYFTFRFLLWK